MCFECVNVSRRRFMSFAASGAAAAGLWAMGGALSPSFAKTSLSADDALAKLKAGNQKFVSSPQLCAAELTNNRTAVAKGQSPWAIRVSAVMPLRCAATAVIPRKVSGIDLRIFKPSKISLNP